MFQRSDYVVGQDFPLLSAVDETDAYVAVGVKILHLLHYILVNAMAVRKILKSTTNCYTIACSVILSKKGSCGRCHGSGRKTYW